MSDMGIEKPADDAFEQDQDVADTSEEAGRQRPDVPLDADEADTAEQERTVEGDDDEYR